MTIGTAFVGAVRATAAAAMLHVPGDFATIQACIDAAASGVDECVVAPGTYHETINFLGKAITVRSSVGADVTTIDATGLNGSVVTCASGEGPDTVLDGFTITGGVTGTLVGGYYTYGGGIYISDSNPTVTNCTFTENIAGGGGGMYNAHGSPTVTNCAFSGNIASRADYGGGGMYNSGGSATVTNCTFTGNSGDLGGGMFNVGGSPTVTHCWFSGNTGISGGGMHTHRSSVTVTNCTFSGNTATAYGGGMATRTSGGAVMIVTSCTFRGNKADFGAGMTNFWGGVPTVTNCTFSGNAATHSGGGIYNFAGPALINCTFGGNTALKYGGAIYNYSVGPTATNCIFGGDSPEEIVSSTQFAEPTIRFSDVQGGLPVGAVDGGGNIDLEPMFVRPPDPGPDGTWDGVDDDYGDLRLRTGSPCIDAGDPAVVAQPGETDLEGHARVLCGRVDMGAYEFGIGDYDCDQVVDLADFSSWQACMTGPLDSGAFHSTIDIRQSTIGCESFDFDGDGSVSLLDFGGFQRVFAP